MYMSIRPTDPEQAGENGLTLKSEAELNADHVRLNDEFDRLLKLIRQAPSNTEVAAIVSNQAYDEMHKILNQQQAIEDEIFRRHQRQDSKE